MPVIINDLDESRKQIDFQDIMITIRQLASNDSRIIDYFKAIKSGIFFGIISLFTVFLTKSWVNHTDKLKELNSNANFILSKNLTVWNFGSLNDRLEPGKWSFLMSATSTKILNFGIFLLLLKDRKYL